MDVGNIVLNFILGMVGQYPVVASVLIVIGIMRAIFKPIFSVARAYVKSTPSTSDDVKLDEFEAGKIYKGIAYVLDLFTSVKLPGIK